MSGLFSCKTKSASAWKGLTDLLSTLHSESFFKVAEDGISFNMFGGQAQYLEAKWSKEDFDEYKFEKEYLVGINLQLLDKIMKRVKKDDEVKFELIPEGVRWEIGTKKYQMQIIRPLEDYQEKPPMSKNCGVEFEIKITELQDKINDVSIVDDFLIVKCNNNLATFSTDSKINKAVTSIPLTEVKEEIDSEYSLMYLNPIISSLRNNVDSIHLGFIPKGPLRIRCNFESLGEIRYFLAPRMVQTNETN